VPTSVHNLSLMSTPGRCAYQAHPPLCLCSRGTAMPLQVCVCCLSANSNRLAKTFADLVLNTGNVIGTFVPDISHVVLFAITVSHFLLSVCWLCPFRNCTWHSHTDSHTDSQLYCSVSQAQQMVRGMNIPWIQSAAYCLCSVLLNRYQGKSPSEQYQQVHTDE